MQVYLDNSATTKVCPQAIDASVNAMKEHWGNPSSLHLMGIYAEEIIENSRKCIADALSCSSEEIFFTSGGTESNNLAIFGAVNAFKAKRMKIITTGIEHPSVGEPVFHLEALGYSVVRLECDRSGNFDERQLFAAVDTSTVLISIMAVNNEIGTIQAVEKAKVAVRKYNSPALIHCDAVQAFGKIPLKPYAMGVDLMSISSHKIHGPKGAGALFVKKGCKFAPTVFGGGQEKNIRPGTQAVPAIAGFGAAVYAMPDIRMQLSKAESLRDYLCENLLTMDGVSINSPRDASPYITNFSVEGIPSEVLLNYLSERDIYISGGSACAKGRRSHVLTAIKLPESRISSAVRVSLSYDTTKEELDILLGAIHDAQKAIIKKK